MRVHLTSRGRRVLAVMVVGVLALVAASLSLSAQSRPADFPYTGISYPAALSLTSNQDCVTFCKYAYACFYRGNAGRQAEATQRHDRFMRDCRRNVCGKPANRQSALGCYNQRVKGSLTQCTAGAQCLVQGMQGR